MNTKDIVKKAKEIAEKTKQRRDDPRYKKAIGFLKAKGLLSDLKTKPRPTVKLDLADVLWVAQKVEPRVYEVLPAALLHFPKTFFNMAALPEDLKNIIDAIKAEKDLNKNFYGIEFKKMNFWANRSLRDRRVKPIVDQKKSQNFRLSPKAKKKLKEQAKLANLTQTEYLEKLICGS